MFRKFGFGDDPFVDAVLTAIGIVLGVGMIAGFGAGLGLAILFKFGC